MIELVVGSVVTKLGDSSTFRKTRLLFYTIFITILYFSYLRCIVDGGWCKWSSWGSCSKSCGGGDQLRKRSCTNPKPSYGGRPCQGEKQEKRNCNTQGCPGQYLSMSATPRHRTTIFQYDYKRSPGGGGGGGTWVFRGCIRTLSKLKKYP